MEVAKKKILYLKKIKKMNPIFLSLAKWSSSKIGMAIYYTNNIATN